MINFFFWKTNVYAPPPDKLLKNVPVCRVFFVLVCNKITLCDNTKLMRSSRNKEFLFLYAKKAKQKKSFCSAFVFCFKSKRSFLRESLLIAMSRANCKRKKLFFSFERFFFFQTKLFHSPLELTFFHDNGDEQKNWQITLRSGEDRKVLLLFLLERWFSHSGHSVEIVRHYSHWIKFFSPPEAANVSETISFNSDLDTPMLLPPPPVKRKHHTPRTV